MKIAIAGYGAEGKSNYRYFKDRGVVTIVDEREDVPDLPPEVPTILGQGAFLKLQDFDMVIRAPGLNPNKIKTSGTIWSSTNEFFAQCTAPIIGVTGTKGKGTTASLIYSILRAGGKKTLLVGNIGQPSLDVLEEANQTDVVVYELSSFQLWDIKKSPQTAVVLMVEPDHLDVHADIEDYIEAKTNIRRFQGPDDTCFYQASNPLSRRIALGSPYGNQAKRYGVPDDGAVYVQDGQFCLDGRAICPISALRLPGKHNLENACAAISAVWQYVQDSQAIESGLNNFSGLDHRLKSVGTVQGVTFYDDSIATTPGSAIAALDAFEQQKVIILGGSAKGADYQELVEACRETGAKVVAIGQTGGDIAKMCRENNVPVRFLGSASMDEIVGEAYDYSEPGSVVILSPASASFDMFVNYGDRGDQFIAAVEKLEGQR